MSTRFWEDTWLGDTPLAKQYAMFSIVQRKQVSVANILSGTTLNMAFRRSLTRNKWDKRLELVNRLMDINLTNTQDLFV